MIPIADNLWTTEPRLIGGRAADGQFCFPMPQGDAAGAFDPLPLSPNGTLWSWTIQNFEPKRPPYQGPVPFEPYMVGYVELPGELIVVSRIVDISDPIIGMPLALRIVPFDHERMTYAFGPAS